MTARTTTCEGCDGTGRSDEYPHNEPCAQCGGPHKPDTRTAGALALRLILDAHEYVKRDDAARMNLNRLDGEVRSILASLEATSIALAIRERTVDSAVALIAPAEAAERERQLLWEMDRALEAERDALAAENSSLRSEAARLRAAIGGALHHDDALKSIFKLPSSLRNELESALEGGAK